MGKAIKTIFILLCFAITAFCGAFYFDTTDDVILLANSTAIPITNSNAFTITFWVYRCEYGGGAEENCFITKSGSNFTTAIMSHTYYSLNHSICLYFHNNEGGDYAWSPDIDIPLNQWVFYGVTFNGVIGATACNFWINGTKYPTSTHRSGGTFASNANTVPIEIGNSGTPLGNFYGAKYMDEVNIFKGVLTDKQMQWLSSHKQLTKKDGLLLSIKNMGLGSSRFTDISGNGCHSSKHTGTYVSTMTIPVRK